jgi:hypothetical protein
LLSIDIMINMITGGTEMITRITKTGKTLTIEIENLVAIARVDGAEVARGMPHKAQTRGNPDPSRWTHQMGPVMLETGEYNTIRAELDAAYQAHQEALQVQFPGLAALQAAREDEDRYHEEFEQMMEDEGNDGARPPRPVQVAYKDLVPQYPRAALYLRAKGFQQGANYDRMAAGTKAVKLLEAGGSESEAEAILNNWLPATAWEN